MVGSLLKLFPTSCQNSLLQMLSSIVPSNGSDQEQCFYWEKSMYHCNSTDCLFSSFTGMIVFFLCVLTIECIIYKIIWKARAWIGDSYDF